MTRQEKENAGRERAIKDWEKVQTFDCLVNADGYRVIGNPTGGKWAKERKISLLAGKTKTGEIRCGYASYEDEAYFYEIKALVEDFLITKSKNNFLIIDYRGVV